ncbi:hypothetical protein B0J14DRAFT_671379 [Halenospora varia]|nr:hypothetical protein B0J14DRAFT_671379 [Halenospora varia]
MPPKTSHELAIEALEAEEDREYEEDVKQNQQEDDAKGVRIRWDGQFEERLHTIMIALRQIPERCLSTLNTTETQVACWIYSINDNYYPKEFKRCQQQSSLKKYFRTWRQLNSYLFRGSYTNCTMMHFVRVLRIDETTYFWKGPCVFTSILARLVWMSRLLFLEFALLEKAYYGLCSTDSPEVSRADFPNPLGRLHHIQKKYVRQDSPYTLDTIFKLLFKGNELHMREGGKNKVMCQTTEEVDNTLVLETLKKKMTLMIKDFHQMRVDVVLATEHMVKQLMYSLKPDVNLDQIHDNLANWNVRYSFLTDEQNKL